ncbi:MAG: universal stress protein [Thermomicrobium sp.]|nr:universal stress protein [Thermomicrobium sp.]MDW8059874.1 universal stress protein [Thermomicrobium sp.]
MIASVVVPLDGSELAEAALPYGKALAERFGASLYLVRVVDIEAPADVAAGARDYLAKVAERLGVPAEITVRYGDPAAEIIDLVLELPDPAIAMTTHGRSGLGRWLYGSVADRVVRGAGVPVLLIRSSMPQREPGVVRSILLPVDGSTLAEAAVPYAKELARRFDATIHLVRVAETPEIYSLLSVPAGVPASAEVLDQLAQQMIETATTYVNELAERLRGEGLRVEAHVLEGIAPEQLLAFERERQPDLVVMATHGRSGLSRVVFGSVAERLLREGTVPLLLIRPPEAVQAS